MVACCFFQSSRTLLKATSILSIGCPVLISCNLCCCNPLFQSTPWLQVCKIAQIPMCSALSSQVKATSPVGGGAWTPLRRTPLGSINNTQVQPCLFLHNNSFAGCFYNSSKAYNPVSNALLLYGMRNYASLHFQVCCCTCFMLYVRWHNNLLTAGL